MEYGYYIWAGAAQSPLARLDRVQKPWRILVGDKISCTLTSYLSDETVQIFQYAIVITIADVQIRYIGLIYVHSSHSEFPLCSMDKDKLHLSSSS